MNLGKRREDKWRDEDVAVSSENGLSSVPKPLMNLDSKCRNLTDPVIPIYSARPDQVKKALNYVYHAATNKLEGKELELLIAILPDNNGSLYGISFAHNFHLFKPEPSWHLPLRWICCFCLLLPRIAASLGFPR